jgi:hypothetical protein
VFKDDMNSTEYLSWLVGADILPVNYGFFALPPQTPAKDKATFDGSGDHNGWNMVMDGADQESSSPFLITRNVKFANAWELATAAPVEVSKQSADYLFLAKRAIVINFGGAAKTFDASALELDISKEAVAPGWDVLPADGGISGSAFDLNGPDGTVK